MANCKPNFGLELRPRLNSHQLSHDDNVEGGCRCAKGYSSKDYSAVISGEG